MRYIDGMKPSVSVQLLMESSLIELREAHLRRVATDLLLDYSHGRLGVLRLVEHEEEAENLLIEPEISITKRFMLLLK